jgi:two-component system phosphate regulon response regulator PhoB
MAKADSDVMIALKGLYLKQLKERLYMLEQAVVGFQLGQAGENECEALGFEVHRLNGTGATYGFPRISKAAKALETYLSSKPCEPGTVVKLLSALITEISDTLVAADAGAPAHTPVFINKVHVDRPANKPTILVVDDDPAILNLVMQLISPLANVACAESGFDAIAMMERRHFDLVILDHELPDMTGLEVLQHAARIASDAKSPVMMLTAMRDPATVSCLISAGAQHYMVKPIAPDKLIERVSLVLNRQKKMIMVVDDDPLIREIFRKKFLQRGYDVLLASNGVQALDMVRRVHPQAIVLDRQMPRLDGMQVLQELRREDQTRLIPVVMLSALARSDDMYSGYREGADAYIAKPFLPDQVIDCCEKLLRPVDIAAQAASVKAAWENSVFV